MNKVLLAIACMTINIFCIGSYEFTNLCRAVMDSFNHFIHWIDIKPKGINSNTLSNIVTLLTAILALMVPLSMEMISRINERFNSEGMLENFNNRQLLGPICIRNLPDCLIVAVITIILPEFFTAPSWRDLYFIAVIFVFLLAVILTWRFIKILETFSSNREILDSYLREIETIVQRE